ncbi:Hypothetical protein, putative [Bodo saltans]|uniref:TOG domain-containing protein n=1 Tax=Bodo saltans TaxID=75058 RepID=A0A0S4JSE0_BODSA|nr:Hypothetical protein, putative [Bodo saltans]|eukprot:CUG94442.1 Hypothetical protein, putative [Bodo saltans]
MSQFDEMPAMSSGAAQPSPYPPGMSGPAEDEEAAVMSFDGLSVDQLLSHSHWKGRKQGLEVIAQNVLAHEGTFLTQCPKLAKEANATVQEQIFETAVQIVENGSLSEAQLKELANHLLKLTIEKGITGRPKAAQTAQRLLSSLTGQRVHEEVTTAIIASFSHKTPKNRQQSLAACAAIIREYGFQSMAPNVVLKAVSPLFSDANALVRKEVQNVFCQCYRYLGAKIQHYFGDLREVQVEEMKKSFGELEVGVAPEKTIRGFASAAAPSRGAGVKAMALDGDGTNDLEMDDETFATLEESVVLSKLPKTFYSVALDKTNKWQDRCAMVKDNLLPLLSVRRIKASDDYHELVKCLRELFIDPQAPLMLIAIQCLQLLCKGLRHSMGPYTRSLIAPIFDKLKDKKTSVLEHMYLTINTMIKSKCLSIDALQDEMEVVTVSKVPNQRSALIAWISGVLDIVELQPSSRLLRAHGMFNKMVNDDKLEVREAAIALLVKMNGLLADGTLQPLLKQLDSKHLMRVLGAGGNKDEDSMVGRLASSIHIADSPSGQSPMKKVARTEKSGPQGLVKSLSASTLTAAAQKRAATSSNPNSLSRSTPSITPTTTPGAAATTASHGDDPVALESGLPSKEDAAAKLHIALCGGDGDMMISFAMLDQLNAKEWKLRCDAVTALAQCIASHWTVERCTEVLDHLVVFLKSTAVWKDSLFQVVNAGILLLHDCTSRATIITMRCAYVILQAFTPRLTEPKSKAPARQLLSVVAEGATPKFVMKHMMTIVQAGKNPKLTQEVNEFFVTLLMEFDGTPVDAKGIVDYVKNFCFEQTQPAVKQSAVSLLGALRKRVGAKLDPFLADINPHLRASLDAEFAKSPIGASSSARCEEEPTQVRKLKASVALPLAKVAGAAAGRQHEGGNAANNRTTSLAEEDLPRVDLSHQLNAINREMTNGKDWKARSIAIKKVEELMLSAHKTVSSNGITETIKSLRSRFDETNKNLVVDALRSINIVLESVEAVGVRPGIKHILPAVLALLSDQKANLREEAAKVCTSGVGIIGLDVSIQMLMKPLMNEAPLSRQIAVDILDKQLEAVASQDNASNGENGLPSRANCIPLVPALLKLAMDRSSEVRAAAERITAIVGPIVGYEAFHKPIMELKPAEQQQVRGLVERQIDRLQPIAPPPVTALPTHLGAIPFSRSDPAHTGNSSGIAAHHHHPHQAPHTSTVPSSVPALSGFGKVSSSHPSHPLAGLGASARTVPPPVSLAAAAAAHGAASARPHTATSEDQPFTVTEILNGIFNVPQDVAFRMCSDFHKRIRKGEDCGSPSLAQVMVDLLHEDATQRNVDLSLGLINCLVAMFSSPRVALRCDCATLVPLLRNIFSCLLSEQFSEIDHKYVQVVVKCLMRLDTERVSPNVVIVSCHDYLLQHPPSAFKSRDDLSIRTIKTIMQAVSRKHGSDLLTLAQTLVGSQNLVSHFIKACLESKDRALRARAEAEQAAAVSSTATSNDSSTTYNSGAPPPSHTAAVPSRYIDPSTANVAPPSAASAPQSTRTSYATSSEYNASASATPSASLSNLPPPPSTPPALSTVVPNVVPSSNATSSSSSRIVAPSSGSKGIAPIFDKIRMHTTSQEGLEELYGYLKISAKECPDFVFQFNKCSPAFRSFIRRQLEKLASADVAKPEWFSLPEVVLQTP